LDPNTKGHFFADYMSELISYWEQFYFAEPLLICCILVSLVISCKYFSRDKMGILFVIYNIANLYLFAFIDYLFLFKSNNFKSFQLFSEINNTIYELLEIFIFLTFYSLTIKYFRVRLALIICFAIYFFFSIAYIFALLYLDNSQYQLEKFSYLLSSFELCILLFFSLLYYLNLFKQPLIADLKTSPSFWVNTGIFFYSITAIPFFSIYYDVEKSSNLYHLFTAAHFITLGLLTLSIARAYLCKKQLTT
jgi:hypothetical protein